MEEINNIIENTLIPYKSFETGLARLRQCIDNSYSASEPVCIAVIGESRAGKSRLIEECQLAYPTSRVGKGMTVPFLYVKTPSKPTVKGLAELFLYAIKDPRYDKGTEYTKTNRLKTLMKNAGTTVVVIDEFQHFVDKGSDKVMHHVADWLKILVDDTRVALVVAGLPSCTAVINQNEQLAGRFVEAVYLSRFDWSETSSREEFKSVLGAFDGSVRRYFDMPDFSQDEMAFRFYCATGGLIGYVAKILREAVWDAVLNQRATISLADLSIAYKKSVWSEISANRMLNPFEREFKSICTPDVLSKVSQIGTAAMIEGRTRNGGKNKLPKLTIGNVITTR